MKNFLTIFCFLLLAACKTSVVTPISTYPSSTSGLTNSPEIPNPNFGDIAAVFADNRSPTGAVIVYNPVICQRIGAACIFFKYHEHGHIALGHHVNSFVTPMIRERDADNYAAQNAPPETIVVAWNLFNNGGSSSNWHTYGSPRDRAKRLCLFAKQAGNWSGPDNC